MTIDEENGAKLLRLYELAGCEINRDMNVAVIPHGRPLAEVDLVLRVRLDGMAYGGGDEVRVIVDIMSGDGGRLQLRPNELRFLSDEQ